MSVARLFEGDSADEVWRKAARSLLQGGGFLRQGSRLGTTREHLHCTFHIRNPRERWVFSRRPALNPAFAIAEVIWILQGRNDAAFLNFWNPALPRFAGSNETYHGAYGHRLRVNLGMDQLERLYHTLMHNPDSRQGILQIWDGQIDIPNPDGTARSSDIPCNVMAMPKVRENRLEWLQVTRSNDLYLGSPHNFVQFTCLQEVMSGWLGIEPGSYVQVCDSLHLYENDIKHVSVSHQRRFAKNADSLALPKKDFDRVLQEMGHSLDELRQPGLGIRRFLNLVENNNVPNAWSNFRRVAAADAARRRGWIDEAEQVVAACTNPALTEAWNNWCERQRPKLN